MADTAYPSATDHKSDLHRTGSNLDNLKADVAGLAHGASQAVHSGAAQLQHTGADALELAKEKLAQGKHAAEDATASVSKLITENPLASIGIATGVGILIGLIMGRPRS